MFPCSYGTASDAKAALRLAVKEKLRISVIQNPQCVVRIPISLLVFEEAFTSCAHTRDRHLMSELNTILGHDWDLRIINKEGDFAFVNARGVYLKLTQMRPITEYVEINGRIEEHRLERGHVLLFRFIRSYGTHQEYQQRKAT